MNLPKIQDPSTSLMLLQTKWSGILNPVIANPVNNVSVLKDVALVTGTNVINHLLGRRIQGWFLTDVQGSAVIYRSGPMNNLTLILNSSADVVVSIGVY